MGTSSSQPPPGGHGRLARVARLAGDDVGLSVFLALLVASSLLTWPLRAIAAPWLLDALFVVTLVFGVLVISPSRLAAMVGGLAAAVVTVQRVAGVERTGLFAQVLHLAFFATVTASLLARVFRPGRVTVHRLVGAVAVFLLLAIDWGIAYQLVLLVDHAALRANGMPASADEAMWMSFVTLTTVGYGDVLPTSPAARSLAALEAFTGMLYPPILIGKLVADIGLVRSGEGKPT